MWVSFIRHHYEDAYTIQLVNAVLRRAWEGNFQVHWSLWISTDKYSEAPHEREDNELSEGSTPPLQAVPSEWLGKSVEDCAKWLREAPAEVALNKHYFAILNEHMKEENTVMLVRIIEDHEEGKAGQLEYFPVPSDQTVLVLLSSGGLKFEEILVNYRRTQMIKGKPDRSYGGPAT
jgi:hypothetical protein